MCVCVHVCMCIYIYIYIYIYKYIICIFRFNGEIYIRSACAIEKALKNFCCEKGDFNLKQKQKCQKLKRFKGAN